MVIIKDKARARRGRKVKDVGVMKDESLRRLRVEEKAQSNCKSSIYWYLKLIHMNRDTQYPMSTTTPGTIKKTLFHSRPSHLKKLRLNSIKIKIVTRNNI